LDLAGSCEVRRKLISLCDKRQLSRPGRQSGQAGALSREDEFGKRRLDVAVEALNQRDQIALAVARHVTACRARVQSVFWTPADGSVFADLHARLLTPVPGIEGGMRWSLVAGLAMLALAGTVASGVKAARFSRRALVVVKEIEAAALDRAMRDPLTGLHQPDRLQDEARRMPSGP